MAESPAQLIENLRDLQEAEAKAGRADLAKWLTILSIAIPAIYTAAGAGNVTCKQAVFEIETVRRCKQ